MTIDFSSKNTLSIFLLRPLTKRAREWVSENIPDDAHFFGAAVVAVGHASVRLARARDRCHRVASSYPHERWILPAACADCAPSQVHEVAEFTVDDL